MAKRSILRFGQDRRRRNRFRWKHISVVALFQRTRETRASGGQVSPRHRRELKRIGVCVVGVRLAVIPCAGYFAHPPLKTTAEQVFNGYMKPDDGSSQFRRWRAPR